MTSNDSITTPEGTHMTTPHPGKRTPTPTIPEAVKELTIKRSDYDDDLHVWIKGSRWSMSITTTDDELLTRINEIAAAMEAVK